MAKRMGVFWVLLSGLGQWCAGNGQRQRRQEYWGRFVCSVCREAGGKGRRIQVIQQGWRVIMTMKTFYAVQAVREGRSGAAQSAATS